MTIRSNGAGSSATWIGPSGSAFVDTQRRSVPRAHVGEHDDVEVEVDGLHPRRPIVGLGELTRTIRHRDHDLRAPRLHVVDERMVPDVGRQERPEDESTIEARGTHARSLTGDDDGSAIAAARALIDRAADDYQAYASGARPPGPGNMSSTSLHACSSRTMSSARIDAPSSCAAVRGPMIGQTTSLVQ